MKTLFSEGYCVTVLKNEIYLSGGQYRGTYSSVLWKLTKSNTWEEVTFSKKVTTDLTQPQSKSHHICPVIKDFILMCGGFNGEGLGHMV